MDSGQVVVRVAAARGKSLKGDFYASCSIDGHKLKTKKNSIPAVPSVDMLGESILSQEDAEQYDMEIRWNDDLVFFVSNVKSSTLHIKLKSQAMVKKHSHGEVSYALSNIDRAEAVPVAVPFKGGTTARLRGAPSPSNNYAPQENPTVVLYKGWLKSDDSSAMFFLFIQFSPAGISLKRSAMSKSNARIEPAKCLIYIKRTTFVSGEVMKGCLAYSKFHPRDCWDNRPPLLVFYGRQVNFNSDGDVSQTSPLVRIGVPLWRMEQIKQDLSHHLESIKPPASNAPNAPTTANPSEDAKKSEALAMRYRYDPGTYIFDFEINLPAMMHPSFIVRTGQQVESSIMYELLVYRPADSTIGHVLTQVPITILPRVPPWAIHNPAPLVAGKPFHVSASSEASVGILQKKLSKYSELPSSTENSKDDPKASESDKTFNLTATVIVPKGYINVNDEEDVTIVAKIENNTHERFVHSVTVSLDFVVGPTPVSKRPMTVVSCTATENNASELPVAPNTTKEIPFVIPHDQLLPEKNEALLTASTRAAPLCSTAMAPLRHIICYLRMDVSLDPKLKSPPLRFYAPVIFIPKYTPANLFKRFDQKLLPQVTPPVAARAIHRPDLTLAVAPITKTDGTPRYFLAAVSAAAHLIAGEAAPTDRLANKTFELVPLTKSNPDHQDAYRLSTVSPQKPPEKSPEKPLTVATDDAGGATPFDEVFKIDATSTSTTQTSLPIIPEKAKRRSHKRPAALSLTSSTNDAVFTTGLLIDLSTPREEVEHPLHTDVPPPQSATAPTNPFAASASSSQPKNPFLDLPFTYDTQSVVTDGSLSDSADSDDDDSESNHATSNWFDD